MVLKKGTRMEIDVEDNYLSVKFPYDVQKISAVKRNKGAYWDSNFRRWLIPFYTPENLKSIMDSLYVFRPFLTFKVRQKLQKVTEREKKKKLLPLVFQELANASTLKDFQKKGILKTLERGSFLIADSMGLGKSASAIFVAETRHRVYDEKTLILCPTSLTWQWEKEILKWIPDAEIQIISGTKKKRQALWSSLSKWNICGYESFRSDDPDVSGLFLICDEASRLKNEKTAIFKIIMSKRNSVSDCLLLTGTPIENNLQDFWNILKFVRPNWMSRQEFYSKYCVWDKVWTGKKRGYINAITGYVNLKDFRERASPYFIRRRKEEVTDLLPKNYEVRYVKFTKSQKEIEKMLKDNIKSSKDINSVLGLFQLLRVNASEPHALELSSSEVLAGIRVLEYSNKLKEVEEIHRNNDEKIVIFTQFARVANILYSKLIHLEPVLITGEVKEKSTLIESFKNSPSRLLISTDTLAYGHSLDEVDIVINYDLPWSLGKIMQREDRVHRISSIRQKNIITLVSGDVEKFVCDTVRKKIEISNKVMDNEEADNLLNRIYSYIKGADYG